MNVYRWEFERDGEVLEVDVEGPLIANDTAMMLIAAEQGLGLAHVLDMDVRENALSRAGSSGFSQAGRPVQWLSPISSERKADAEATPNVHRLPSDRLEG